MITLNLAKEFSPYPAGRYPDDGEFNGQRFRDKVLLPLLEKARIVQVNIDGVATLPSSFWEETWGGMVRKRRIEKTVAQSRLMVVTSEPDLERYVELAKSFLAEAEPEPAT